MRVFVATRQSKRHINDGEQIMYVSPNFKTKKALKDALAAGEKVTVYSPGPFPCPEEGVVAVEGPHFPEPHRWYAMVRVSGGLVTGVK